MTWAKVTRYYNLLNLSQLKSLNISTENFWTVVPNILFSKADSTTLAPAHLKSDPIQCQRKSIEGWFYSANHIDIVPVMNASHSPRSNLYRTRHTQWYLLLLNSTSHAVLSVFRNTSRTSQSSTLLDGLIADPVVIQGSINDSVHAVWMCILSPFKNTSLSSSLISQSLKT